MLCSLGSFLYVARDYFVLVKSGMSTVHFTMTIVKKEMFKCIFYSFNR